MQFLWIILYRLDKSYSYYVLNLFFYCRFKIEQLTSQRKYLVDLEFNICPEPGVCDISFVVFKEHLLPQVDCDLAMDYQVASESSSKKQ